MNKLRAAVMIALMGLAASCANEPRSRDTANSNVAGETLAAQVCSNCHGATGNSKSPNFPNLAAQQEAYLITQLTGFRGHSRKDPAGYEYMWGLSRNLSDGQIHDLATYYAAQTPARQPVERAAERIAAGKTIFSGGIPDQQVPACATCHGAEGKGNATFPRIAGQHADYLVKQLTVFQKTDQRPAGQVMKGVAHALSAQNIDDVAAYLQALPNQ